MNQISQIQEESINNLLMVHEAKTILLGFYCWFFLFTVFKIIDIRQNKGILFKHKKERSRCKLGLSLTRKYQYFRIDIECSPHKPYVRSRSYDFFYLSER
jgi:hypothetical protein